MIKSWMMIGGMTCLGSAGTVVGLILASWVGQLSLWATVLLIPYLLWSHSGTWITWRMYRLNKANSS